MPPFDEAQLQAHIGAGRIGAVSLDTSILDQYQSLISPVLLGLRQFRGSGTRLVLSEVVLGELKSHVRARAADTKHKLHSAFKDASRSWQSDANIGAVDALLRMNRTPDEFAGQAIAEFAADVGFEHVAIDGLVSHSDVLRKYFDMAPPFSSKEAKKREFPDALALLSLDAWAAQHKTVMLLVSRDEGWKSFAENSERLICVNDLPTALNFFNRESRFVAERALGLLRRGEAKDLRSSVDSILEAYLETFDPDIHAWSAMEYEVDSLECTLQHWEVEEGVEPKVLSADTGCVIFSMTVGAHVNFSATFSLSVRDSVDRDYVSMGSNTVEREKTIDLQLVVSVNRQFDHEPEGEVIEVTPPRVSIDFGDIDPDWRDEES